METGTGFRLSRISFRYKRVQVLDDLTLDYPQPGVFGLLGPNGAGKTTILRLLATVLWPDSGSVRLLGLDPNDADELRTIRSQLGYLPQGPTILPGVPVRSFLRYMAWLRLVPTETIPANITRVAETMGIGPLLERKTSQLSGGERRRVEIAQALLNHPRLLILDEPTAGLDPNQRVEFREVVREVGNRATVVLATHLVEDVVAICDHILVIAGGKVLFRGSSAELGSIGRPTPGISAAEAGYRAVIEAG